MTKEAELALPSTCSTGDNHSLWGLLDSIGDELDPLEPWWPSEDFSVTEPSPESSPASSAPLNYAFLEPQLGFGDVRDAISPWLCLQSATSELQSSICDNATLQRRVSDSSCISETMVLQLSTESTAAAPSGLCASPGNAQSFAAAASVLPDPSWAAEQQDSRAAEQHAVSCNLKTEQPPPDASGELSPCASQHAEGPSMPIIHCSSRKRAAAGKIMSPRGGKRQQLQLAHVGSRRAGGLDDRARDVQRKYLERKKKRENALFERVEELRARKAALERGIVPVLARYDILTSRLPLCQLQGEAQLLASVAAGVPDMLLELRRRDSGLHRSAPGHFTSLLDQAAALDSCCSPSAPASPGPGSSEALELRSFVACLGVGRQQRMALAERSAATLAEVAELRAQAASLVSRLQALGACVKQQPSLAWVQRAVAGHLTCAQLSGISQREARLAERLLRWCRMAVQGTREKAMVADTETDIYALCQAMLKS